MNEIDLIKQFDSFINNTSPVISNKAIPSTLIVGSPRSGTTALLQFLSDTGVFSYPTNCLTRFSASMELATIIQELIYNKDFGLEGNVIVNQYESNYGRSIGALNTNEFFHFFRRFLPNSDIRYLTSAELKEINVKGMMQQLSVLSRFYGKPFVTKALMLQYNLDFFQPQLDNSIILYIKRDDIYVMQSIYIARLKECDSIDDWWSAKPKEYLSLLGKDIYKQIAGQVYYTNKTIELALEKIPEKNKFIISYIDFIKSPMSLIDTLIKKYSDLGFDLGTYLNLNQDNLNNIKCADRYQLDEKILDKLNQAFEQLVNYDK